MIPGVEQPGAIRVEVPVRATVNETYQVLEAVAEIERAPPGPVTLDASRCERFGPVGIALLAMACAARLERGEAAVELIAPENDGARGYLEEVRFAQFLESRPRGYASTQEGTPAMRLLTMSGLAYSYPKEVAELITERVPGATEDASYPIQFCLNELLQNVFEHAFSKPGCITHARWYAAKKNVRLAVVDAGIGIPAALRRGKVEGMHKRSDADVIVAAVTQEGLTSRKGGRKGGLGLKLIRDFVLPRAGVLTVISHGAKVTFKGNSVRKVKSPYYRGTAVEIDFRPYQEMASSEGGIF